MAKTAMPAQTKRQAKQQPKKQTQKPAGLAAHHDQIALALQGGGALGAYQAGVFEELASTAYRPAWIAGVSIGTINAALIPGNVPVRRFDPNKMGEWSSALPKDKEILLFCAHGRSISNASVDFLTKNGYQARLIAGGFDSWKDAGGATLAKAP